MKAFPKGRVVGLDLCFGRPSLKAVPHQLCSVQACLVLNTFGIYLNLLRTYVGPFPRTPDRCSRISSDNLHGNCYPDVNQCMSYNVSAYVNCDQFVLNENSLLGVLPISSFHYRG